MSEKVRVIVWASGGVVTGVSAGPFVEILIHDEDEGDDETGPQLQITPADAWSTVCDEVWAQATEKA